MASNCLTAFTNSPICPESSFIGGLTTCIYPENYRSNRIKCK